MKILLLGANGGIGTHILKIALENGENVIAYVRRKEAIDIKHERLSIVVGNLQNEKLLEPLIKDADVVISALGPAMDMSRKVKSTPLADAHEMVLRIMKKWGRKRFITIGTPTVQGKDDVKHFSNTILPIIPKILFPTGYVEYRKMGEIMNQSDLDWTVVRFLDPKAKHKNDNYQVRLDGKSTKFKISRKNIANFVYKVASENLYIRQMPIVFH